MISKNLHTSRNVLVNITNYTNTSDVFTFDSEVSVLDCHSLTVNVTAVSSIGESTPGTVEANYPIGKKLVSQFAPHDHQSRKRLNNNNNIVLSIDSRSKCIISEILIIIIILIILC